VCHIEPSFHSSSTDTISEDSTDRFGHDHEFTKLVIDLKGKDPDDAFSSIPYEKVGSSGHSFSLHAANLYRVSTSCTT
jgi:hypothetical protein